MKWAVALLIVALVFVAGDIGMALDEPVVPTKMPTVLPTKVPTPLPTFAEPEKPIEPVAPEMKVVVQGDTPIAADIASKPEFQKANYLAAYTDIVMRAKRYPLTVFPTKQTDSTVKILRHQCNGANPPEGQPANVCGYWLEVSRGGYVVPVDNPVWLVNPPTMVVVSETTDTKTLATTTVVKEDLYGSVEGILQGVADRTPVSKKMTQAKLDEMAVGKTE